MNSNKKKNNMIKKTTEFENILQVNKYIQSRHTSKKFNGKNYKFQIPTYLNKKINNQNFNLEKDWEKIKEINISSIENIICVICLNKNEEMKLGHVLRCHHFFCLSCIINNFIKYKKECPICHEKFILMDLKKVNIFLRDIQKNDKLDFYLMKKYKNNSKIGFIKKKTFNNFLKKINFVSKVVYENSVFNDIRIFLEFADKNIFDFYLKEFIEFFFMKKLQIFHKGLKNNQFNLIEPLTQSKTKKIPILEYFYQITSGHNIFLDPLQFKYLLLNKQNDIKKLDSVMENIKILDLEKKSLNFKQNKKLQSLSHVGNLNNFVIIKIDLKNFICENLFNQYILEIEKNELVQIENKDNRNYQLNDLEYYHHGYESDKIFSNFEREILQYDKMEKKVLRNGKKNFSGSKTKSSKLKMRY